MMLTVQNIGAGEAWKDIVQIPNKVRNDMNGKHIPRGTVCSIKANGRSRYVIVRGLKHAGNVIGMDLNLRLALKTSLGHTADFELRRASWIGYLRFTWSASDPVYRVPAQISIVSFILERLSAF